MMEKYQKYIIIGLLIFFSVFTLWIRILPVFNMNGMDILNVVGSDDPLYNLRQVEWMLHNFPSYSWFDAMTHFPTGDFIYWGPLFTYILTIACMIAGATTRPEIIFISLLIPPIMAAVMIPVVYLVGKLYDNWKTGLCAAAIMAIISGQYFSRSLYGYVDHHIAEVLFATIFCLAYIYAIKSSTKADFKKSETLKLPILLASIAGIAYIVGFLTMPTIILFAMIIAIFTLVQSILDFFYDNSMDYLLLVNTIVSVIAITGSLLVGIKAESYQLDLALYSSGHIYAHLGLIGGTLLLYLLAKYLKSKNKFLYPLAIAGAGISFSIILIILSQPLFTLLVSSFFLFFGQQATSLTIQEARGWSIDMAIMSFNWGIVLLIVGLVILTYKSLKGRLPHHIFILIWSLIIFISTCQHVRYEYYLAVNIAIAAAIAISFAMEIAEDGLSPVYSFFTSGSSLFGNDTPSRKQKRKPMNARIFPFLMVSAIALVFIYSSTGYDYAYANGNPSRMNQDWKESLEWLGAKTPDSGVDYLASYDLKTFKYPPQAYGVMSWWDYGHMITYISKRIPNANPFQRGVAGGSADFFMATSEQDANTVLDTVGTRYIITDIEMDTGKFWAMATWYNPVGIQPYQEMFIYPDQNNNYQITTLNKQQYYLTMISKLHNFDGAMTSPQKALYVEYMDNAPYPIISYTNEMEPIDAMKRASDYNSKVYGASHASVYGVQMNTPIEVVPALQHYRLVHESPTSTLDTIKYVKIFEYVKGAHIKGDGIIEIPIMVLSSKRQIIYRQQSINGEFIVPYPTDININGIHTGKYIIASKQYNVTEQQVLQGQDVQ